MGNVIIAEAAPETMTYVAGYVTKKAYGNDTKRYNELGLPAPYCRMSRNPGLGYDYYQEHKEQMYKDDGFIYLEHGAHYAIGALALIMLLATVHIEVPEIVTGLIGIAFIVWAVINSISHRKQEALKNPS